MCLSLHCLLSVCAYVPVPFSYKDISSIPLDTSPMTVFSNTSENTLCPNQLLGELSTPVTVYLRESAQRRKDLAWPHGFSPWPCGHSVSGPMVRQTTM